MPTHLHNDKKQWNKCKNNFRINNEACTDEGAKMYRNKEASLQQSRGLCRATIVPPLYI